MLCPRAAQQGSGDILKANARPRLRGLEERDEGQTGIGTMIIFIATILTAAVAAGVVIDTTNNLQEKAQRTGLEATEQVSNNIGISTVQGIVNSNGTALDALNISLTLTPGSKQVDLSQMLIRLSNGSTVKQLAYNANGTGANFSAVALRDPDGAFTSATPVLTAGALVSLNLNLNSTGIALTIGVRKTMELTLQPEVGSRLATELRTPASFTAGQVVLLR